ncbi:MAG: hypothetical protein WAT43_11625, partial [Chitinophagales bacterium]
MKYLVITSCLLASCFAVFSQDSFIRFENNYGHAKFVGGDESGMVDNKTFGLGLIYEHEVYG